MRSLQKILSIILTVILLVAVGGLQLSRHTCAHSGRSHSDVEVLAGFVNTEICINKTHDCCGGHHNNCQGHENSCNNETTIVTLDDTSLIEDEVQCDKAFAIDIPFILLSAVTLNDNLRFRAETIIADAPPVDRQSLLCIFIC